MILNLFKSKPTLKELIPNGFVDIHSHILPGIDDGAKNVEESMRLIYEMKKLGFSKIIGTPHTYPGVHDNTNESIITAHGKIRNKLPEGIKVCYSSEYMIDESLYEKIEKRSLLPIKEKYILIEMSYIGESSLIFDLIFKLLINDYIPILAHPERYLYYNDQRKKYNKLKLHGCKFQLNLLSLSGYYGPRELSLSNYMLKNNFIDFIAGDFHHLGHLEAVNNKIRLKNKVDKIEEILERTKNTFQ